MGDGPHSSAVQGVKVVLHMAALEMFIVLATTARLAFTTRLHTN
jgi:hypothetical protein